MTGEDVRPHPYVDLEGTALWIQVDQAITDLLKNRDLTETTSHLYVVGYICRKLIEADVVRE